jgi:3-keto-5-aminohexanoate cleavage enzyme
MTTDDKFYGQRFTHYDRELPSPVMNKKLVINVAPTGAFIKREQNPHQSYTPSEVARQVIDAYKVGATVFHVHVRDERGIIQLDNVPLIKEALDLVLDECPDMLLSHSGHAASLKDGAAAKTLVGPLVEAGQKTGRNYVHTMVVLPLATHLQYVDEAGLKETIQYLQNNNVVPEFQIDNYRALHNVIRWVIDTGILKKPYVINLLSGLHGPTVVGPGLPDPWGRIHWMTMLHCMRQMLPDECVFGATIGGHHWLPVTVEAIMLGVDCVRVGMEDTLWLYPHREDRIESCAQVVNKVATIARELGRDIATTSEARDILGLS